MFTTSSYDPKSEITDLSGKVAIVTGGNVGIGYETVKLLTKNGAKVYLGSRNEQRGKDAIIRLQQEGALEHGSVELLLVDLSSIKDAKRAAEEFLGKESRLDILINNAAQVAGADRTVTKEGIPTQLATNHFGHFVLTATLLPLLEQTAKLLGSDVRVVNVASTMHEQAPVITKITTLNDLDVCPEPGITNGVKRYGLTKLCNIWFTRELQKRLTDSGSSIIVLCLHPGMVATPGTIAFFDNLPRPLSWIAKPISRLVIVPEDVGGYTSLFAATSVKVREGGDKYKAVYLMPPGIITTPKGQGLDGSLAAQLWDLSEKVVEEVLSRGSVDMEA